MTATSPTPEPAQVEDDLWDALNDTMAARCCDCPSCNYYLPEGEYKPESKCVHRAAIEALMAHAWMCGHVAGRDYQGDGWNSDAHDPEDDNPYTPSAPR